MGAVRRAGALNVSDESQQAGTASRHGVQRPALLLPGAQDAFQDQTLKRKQPSLPEAYRASASKLPRLDTSSIPGLDQPVDGSSAVGELKQGLMQGERDKQSTGVLADTRPNADAPPKPVSFSTPERPPADLVVGEQRSSLDATSMEQWHEPLQSGPMLMPGSNRSSAERAASTQFLRAAPKPEVRLTHAFIILAVVMHPCAAWTFCKAFDK